MPDIKAEPPFKKSSCKIKKRREDWRGLVNLRDGLCITLGFTLTATIWLAIDYKGWIGLIIPVEGAVVLVICLVAYKAWDKEQKHNARINEQVKRSILTECQREMDYAIMEFRTAEWSLAKRKLEVSVSFRSASPKGHVLKNVEMSVDAKLWVLLRVWESIAPFEHVLGAKGNADSIKVPPCSAEDVSMVFARLDDKIEFKTSKVFWCTISMNTTAGNLSCSGPFHVVI